MLSVLPCIHDEFQRTGQVQNLLIAKQFAPVVDGVDYVRPIIYDGHWQDLHGALRQAKREFKRVIVPSTFGKDFPIQHLTPSFQLDQFFRAGKLQKFDSLPLVLPRPSNAAELVATHLNGTRCILLSDHSESSPFDHRDDLWKTLNFHFGPTHKIIRLSEIKLPSIKDFLPLFDAADAIVSIDTAFLHLSAASTTPVVALATDKPERWHGTAWSKRFALHCRYSDFPTRKDEMIRCVDNILQRREGIIIHPVLTSFSHGYNLSITRYKGHLISAYRYHPDKSKWRSELVIDDGNGAVAIQMPKEIADNSNEDARLFHYQDKLWMSYTTSVFPTAALRCVVGCGELEKGDTGWRLARHIQPKFGTNDFTSLQKNWLFFESDGKLYAIFGSHPDQVVIQLNDDTVVAQHRTPGPKWDFGEIRGGAIIPHQDKLLRFFHSRSGSGVKNYEFQYHIGALLMERTPPFKVISVSKHPILSGHEGWTPSCPQWKPGVVFPGGAIPEGGGWKLSLGVNDSCCAIADIRPEHLNLC